MTKVKLTDLSGKIIQTLVKQDISEFKVGNFVKIVLINDKDC